MAEIDTETRASAGEGVVPKGVAGAADEGLEGRGAERVGRHDADGGAATAHLGQASTGQAQGPLARASSRPSTGAAGGPLAAYESVARSARLPDLVAITQSVVAEAAAARRSEWNFAAKVTTAADDAKLPRSESETPFGNALKVLSTGPEGDAERSLAGALWAHAIAESRRDDEDRLAGDILWLAAHTAFDATPLLDRALGDDADDLWRAIADRVRRVLEGRGSVLGRGEALLGCIALASSPSDAARKACVELGAVIKDPAFQRILAGAESPGSSEVHLEGEVTAAPRSALTTAVLGLTGILFVVHAVGFVARLALAYRRPAELVVSRDGVRLRSRTQMLGRTLKEREHVIVRAGLVRVVREVRYPRAAFYAGLLALAVGSWIGVRALVDGVRAASPSLLLAGLLIVAIGIAADFLLGSVLPGARGRCRIAFVPRAGKTLCVGDVDARRADDALANALRAS